MDPRDNPLLFPGLLKKAAKWLDFNWDGRRPRETFPAHPLAKITLTMGLTPSRQVVMAYIRPSLCVDDLGSDSSAKDLGGKGAGLEYGKRAKRGISRLSQNDFS